MSQQSSLGTLYRVRQQEVERDNLQLSRVRQQLARIKQQIEQLRGYREDYRVHVDNRGFDSTERVLDRQLFLARLEQSIDTLVQNQYDLSNQEIAAISDLRASYERAQALKKVMDRLQLDHDQQKLKSEQSQCDEQGRIATNCRLGIGN